MKKYIVNWEAKGTFEIEAEDEDAAEMATCDWIHGAADDMEADVEIKDMTIIDVESEVSEDN